MITTAVIIAGGASLRLRPLSDDRPKTLIEVRGKPILCWILQWLKKNGIGHAVIGVAYKKEMIYDYIKANDNFGMKIDFSEHTVEGGTAQAFKLAISRFVKDDDFLAMNGDELSNMSLSHLWEVHSKHRAVATIALAPFHSRFTIVELDGKSRVTGFAREKKLHDAPVHIGINVFNRKIMDYIPDTGNFEESVFPPLIKQGSLFYYMLRDDETWMSVNTQKDLEEANSSLTDWLDGPTSRSSPSRKR